MKISQKLTIGLFCIVLLVILSGVVGIYYAQTIHNELTLIASITAPSVVMVDKMSLSLWKSHNSLQEFLSQKTSEKLDLLQDQYDQQMLEFIEAEKKLRILIKDQTLMANLDTAVSKQRSFNRNAIELMKLQREYLLQKIPQSARESALHNLIAKTEQDMKQSTSILEEISLRVTALNQQADEASSTAVKTSLFLITFTAILSIGVAFGVSLYLSRMLLSPISHLTSAAEKVGRGDFSINIKPQSSDELGHLTAIFNQMATSLQRMIEESPRMKKFLKLQISHSQQPSLEPGNSYLIKYATALPVQAFHLLSDLQSKDFIPLCFTRLHPAQLREIVEIQANNVVWLSETKEDPFFSTTDLLKIQKAAEQHLKTYEKAIIIIERIDFLLSKHNPKTVLNLVSFLKDEVHKRKAILLLPVDPTALNSQELSFLEKELHELPLEQQTIVSPELRNILAFIHSRNKLRNPVSFKDIGRNFNITAPTTQKKLLELSQLKLIQIVRQGRNKILEPTPLAEHYLSRK